MLVSILLHVAVFLVLDHLQIGHQYSTQREIVTERMNVQQVEVRPLEPEKSAPPEDLVIPPNNAAALLEEVDLLAKLPADHEVDIKPSILEPEYALRMTQPAAEGEPAATAQDFSAVMEIEADLPDLGRMEQSLPPAAIGQITVDPGALQADEADLRKIADDLLKQGAHGKVKDGALDGVSSLDDLIGLPANVLVNKKTMLPSDLLFDFNSPNLRESAKVGLMKLGLLIDRNPALYCWIEGHTDLIGGDDFNLDLSRHRAEAVREYLVKALRMDGDKILARGKGKYEPLVKIGNADEQAPNRRVEIRMRKLPPPPEPKRTMVRAATAPAAALEPPRATAVRDLPEPPTTPKAAAGEVPRAVPVPLQQAIPVEPAEPLHPLEIPRVQAVDE
ncbi:MAG: OmpA family protein [Verrucomicrobia bacterium]|nr:MAG: OmpA family protein [Verrucomicrobiota bacterium]